MWEAEHLQVRYTGSTPNKRVLNLAGIDWFFYFEYQYVLSSYICITRNKQDITSNNEEKEIGQTSQHCIYNHRCSYIDFPPKSSGRNNSQTAPWPKPRTFSFYRKQKRCWKILRRMSFSRQFGSTTTRPPPQVPLPLLSQEISRAHPAHNAHMLILPFILVKTFLDNLINICRDVFLQ